jgi:hypothetical protein
VVDTVVVTEMLSTGVAGATTASEEEPRKANAEVAVGVASGSSLVILLVGIAIAEGTLGSGGGGSEWGDGGVDSTSGHWMPSLCPSPQMPRGMDMLLRKLQI